MGNRATTRASYSSSYKINHKCNLVIGWLDWVKHSLQYTRPISGCPYYKHGYGRDLLANSFQHDIQASVNLLPPYPKNENPKATRLTIQLIQWVQIFLRRQRSNLMIMLVFFNPCFNNLVQSALPSIVLVRNYQNVFRLNRITFQTYNLPLSHGQDQSRQS